MTKYHIGKGGIPRICKAVARPCPYGGDEAHFTTIEGAQMAADNLNQQLQSLNENQAIGFATINNIARQGYSLDALLEDTPIRDKNIDELGNHNNVESDTKTDKKDDLESLSTDELVSLLRGEMNDLDISLKQDMPELNKSLDINNYRPKE